MNRIERLAAILLLLQEHAYTCHHSGCNMGKKNTYRSTHEPQDLLPRGNFFLD